jgi:hypothetical protein
VLRDRGKSANAEPRPGFVLTYHGSDIAVVERIDLPDDRGWPALAARGGISGSLRYTVPAGAVCAVYPEQRRVVLADDVTFEPEAVGHDGDVRLIARAADSRLAATRAVTPRPRTVGTRDPRTAGVVVLCMSLSAGIALAIKAIWLWVPWLILTFAALLALAVATTSGRAPAEDAPD